MTITDEKIKPYLINLTSENYDVLEDTGKVNKEGQRVFKTHGHFSSVESALNKISKLLVETNKSYTVSEYVETLKQTRINLTQL